METVNLSRAVMTCNSFHFFFAAAKASLVPFLTLFCRLMGLSATETGIIMAVKTITGFIWSPLWSKCAIAYNKRRTVLMFAIFIMAATYLSLSVVFTAVKDQEQMCKVDRNIGNKTFFNTSLNFPTHKVPAESQTRRPDSKSTIKPKPTTAEVQTTLAKLTTTPSTTTTTTETTTVHIRTSTHLTSPTTVHSEVENGPATPPLMPVPTPVNSESDETSVSMNDIVSLFKQMLEKSGLTIHDIQTNNLTPEEVFYILDSKYPDYGLTLDVFKSIWPMLMDSDSNERARRSIGEGLHNSWNTLRDKVSGFITKIEEEKWQLFVIVLAIIIFGEFFCSPVEKVADDSWFDYLDRVDDLEKYGKQRLTGSFAFILLPIAASLAVDYTPCLLPFHIHHFVIHFYMYGFFLGITFLIAFFYPVPAPHKQKTKSKVMKGLQIICCDCRGFLYVVTLLIMGMTYASVHIFLFWVIQDLGGSEINMGLCVTIGAMAEIPMLMFSGKLVNKVGNAGLISLALFAMMARTLYYSFLQIPWAVLPAELLHAFTHTAMWYAVLSYDEFNVGPGLDRSIRSILSSMYFGVGFTIGSLFSGVVYDLFGSSVLFWSGSVLTGTWAVVFFLISLCLPKKEKIRYVRLLQSGDEESDGDDDDWLEMALKDQ